MTHKVPQLDRAAGWIDANIEQFRLCHAQSDDARVFLMKPLGELALTAAVLSRCAFDSAWCGQKVKFAWDELGGGDALLHLLSARPDLIVASTLYACFRQFGHRNRRLDILIRHLAATAACRAIEFPRWRRLDVAHAFDALEIEPFPPDAHVGTWVVARPEPWMLTDDVAYAVTHEIFYITDFGRVPERLPASVRSYVTTWLPAWLKIYAAQSNWDLFAEFVMVGASLNLPQHAAVRLLMEQLTPDGHVPGPRDGAANLIRSNDTGARVRFLRNYHTTLVAMMAFALAKSAQSSDRVP